MATFAAAQAIRKLSSRLWPRQKRCAPTKLKVPTVQTVPVVPSFYFNPPPCRGGRQRWGFERLERFEGLERLISLRSRIPSIYSRRDPGALWAAVILRDIRV